MQYSGFVVVRVHPVLVHETNYHESTAVAEALQAETNWNVMQDAKLLELNGEWYFRAIGNTNHASGFEPVRELLEKIVARAPGSYGLFYVNDDEDPVPELRDVYRVLVIRRGTIIESFDPFLSPLTPVVKDPFDMNEL